MKIEPSSDARSAAIALQQMRLALQEAGFTRREALGLIHVILAKSYGED
jgi:hypothetical protein